MNGRGGGGPGLGRTLGLGEVVAYGVGLALCAGIYAVLGRPPV